MPARLKGISWGRPSDIAAALAWEWQRLPARDRPRRIVWAVNVASFADASLGDLCSSPIFHERATDELYRLMGCARGDTPSSPWGGFFDRPDAWSRSSRLTRLALLARALGVSPPPAPTPYVGTAPELRRATYAEWARLGIFKGGLLQRNAAAMLYVRRLCDAYGITLTFVILPEPAQTREQYRPDLHPELTSWLARYGAVHDQWTMGQEFWFYDHAHMNVVGRDRYGPIFERAVGQ
jgi:hypothetical protein